MVRGTGAKLALGTAGGWELFYSDFGGCQSRKPFTYQRVTVDKIIGAGGHFGYRLT